MNNSSNHGTGGASIKPSARPSIHNHHSCPFASANNMVRYGMEVNKADQHDDSSTEEGVDEVDNIISKPAKPIGSPSRNKIKKGDRLKTINSLHRDETEQGDIETSVLSKSVPATLPSYSHYSDDSEDLQINEHRSDVSYHSVGTPSWSKINGSTSITQPPHTFSLRPPHGSPNSLTQGMPHMQGSPNSFTQRTPNLQGSPRFIPERNGTTQANSSKYTMLTLVLVLMTVCASVMLNVAEVEKVRIYDESQFYTDVSGLGEKYNVNENSILQVQSGISTIFKRQDTGSFMFVYNSNDNNFNPNEFNKFVNEVSFAASKYLRNDSTPVLYTTVDSTKLDMLEHSELITRYREDLGRTGVMLVRHLEAIPSTLAMAFHYYCDEYNPLVKKSAIFFTLNLAKCPQESDRISHAMIEKCLAMKWSSVPPESIGPLLTRVVSVVIDVTSAF